MKAGVAALAFATIWLADNRDQWRGRLSFTAVADETVFGPDGAEALLAARPDLLGDALICAEGPGFMQLGLAEKGVFWVRFEAVAPPLQGMMGIAGQSAVVRLAQVLLAIDVLNDIQTSPPATLSALTDGAGEHGLRISANIGTIAGGSFVSQGAERVIAEVDFRIPPGLTLADVAARLDAIVAEVPGVAWTRIKGWEPNWTPPDAAISQAVADACWSTRGAAPQAVVRLPASDASRWRAQGVPAVCFGPQPLLVSGVDDYVIRDDIIDCAIIYTRAALSFLGRAQGARS